MKTRVLLAGLLSMTCLSAEEVAKDPHAAWFDQIAKIAAAQTKESVEMAEETEYAEDLVPLEKRSGKEWQAILEFIEASGSEELKIRTLLVEFHFALTGAYYDLEEAGGKIEELAAKAKIARYKSTIKQLDLLLAEAK